MSDRMGGPTPPRGTGSESAAWWTRGRRHYVLVILCLVGTFNFIDRQIITILLEPIKRDLGVSDTAMGLLSGVAFAGFYVTAAIPLARLADRRRRNMLVAACLSVWSLSTALCGFVQNFLQLAIVRIGVAGGEAGAYPASQSILADLYPVSRRATVIGILLAAQSVGIAFGLFLGGWLNSAFSWRIAFMVVGTPGLILAAIIWLTVKEPPRGLSDLAPHEKTAEPTLAEVVRLIAGSPPLMLLLAGAIFGAFTGYSVLGWAPTFFIRTHALSTMQAGFFVGASIASGLLIGNVGTGSLADRLAKGNLSIYMAVAGACLLLGLPFLVYYTLAASTGGALLGLFMGNLLMTGWLAPSYAVAVALVPPNMRAMISAIIGFCMTLFGIGLGPLAVGMLNDALAPSHGDQAIRYSLLIINSGALVGGVLCFTASRLLRSRR